MTKKNVAIFLIFLMMAVSVTACSGSNSGNTATSSTSAEEESTSTNSTSSAENSGGGPGGGGPGGNVTIDASTLVADIPAAFMEEGTPDTSVCSSGDTDARILCLAQAFEATLTDEQKTALQYELTAENAALWSNLPVTMVERNGLMVGTLSEESVEAFKALAYVALGEDGYEQLKENILGDEYLVTSTGNTMWNGEYYYIAYLGEPSADSPWILQIGGHHYASNLTFNTDTEGATPMFVGIEPVSFESNGVTYSPLATRQEAMYGIITSLDETQLASAKLSQTFDDVLLGPGQDNAFLESSEGVLVSSLSEQQQGLVKTAITEWVKDINPELSEELLAAYLSDEALAETKIAWSGSTNPSEKGSYVRIDGPRVWIEFASQGGIGFDAIHYHTVWRDKAADYGGSFSG